MAIGFGGNATFVNPASGANNLFTTAGANRYLFCNTLIQGSQTVSGVTHNGAAMSLIVGPLDSGNVSAGEHLYLWGLGNANSGTNLPIVVTYTGASTMILDCSYFTGAQQTTAIEASGTATGTTGTATKSIVTLTDNDWLVGFARAQSAPTAGANTTLRSANGGREMMDSNGVQHPAGSFALNYTTLSNNNWAIIVAALQPVATNEAFQPISQPTTNYIHTWRTM